LKFSKKVLIGTITGTLLLSATAFGATKIYTKNISARFASIKLVINDDILKPKVEPFIYDGNVYAPVATIANALGIRQFWVNNDPATQSPSVHFEGLTMTNINQRIANDTYKSLIPKDGIPATFIPLGGDVYLLRSGKADDTTLYLKDYSKLTKMKYSPTFTDAEKIADHQFVDYVPGSVDRVDVLPNDLTFMIEQNDIQGDTTISTYKWDFNHYLRIINTMKIKHDPGIWTKTTKTIDSQNNPALNVQYYKGSGPDSKLIGFANFQIKNGELIKTDEMFK
jgi:hypothetical protein